MMFESHELMHDPCTLHDKSNKIGKLGVCVWSFVIRTNLDGIKRNKCMKTATSKLLAAIRVLIEVQISETTSQSK